MKIKTELHEYAQRRGTTGPYADNLDVDALVVGGGFGGIYCWYELKKAGFHTVIYEAGNDLGGTWRWNCYPGAGVDSEIPEYQLSIPETYKDWVWPNNYPDYKDLRAYFDHCDKVLGIKKETAFNSVVVDAQFNTREGKWTIKTADGRTAKAKYFVVAAGFAAKRYIPDEFVGIDDFQGIVHHSSFWPDMNIDVRGKKCAVIGTGASGVQITQAWGPVAGELKVFQRTPNLAVPMRKRSLTAKEQNDTKVFYPELFRYRERNFGGFLYGLYEKGTFEDTEEEREKFYQKLWDEGGFRFWLANYKDYLFDMKANRKAYDFWAKNVRTRIGDPRLRDLLAPLEPPHPFGVKRPCLEQTYYEQFNRPNVDVVDIKNNPIVGFTSKGIKLQDGTVHEFDVVVIATGFDITTGGMTSMGLKNIDGVTLQSQWKKAAYTYLGTTIAGYPNMFHLYGPHGPTLLSNGPTSVEVQGRWIVDAIKQIERQGLKYVNPTDDASKKWKARINELSDKSLFPTTKSTYMGGSMPGKAFEQVNYAGGLPAYADEIRAKLPNFEGFEKVKK
ncbi:Baeyer-Villiger monooxygenase [Alternaria arborescens]|jgi:cation diffusion facilitator CzcD-associated flavoprotein CzcO|uniref:Baeyer-Villiger monooxygenase n=1 Tax=Alternaria arborescens TaxID=156630 RepID=UPI001074F3FB|nr:Baeyer-Villiger monooxygenase [Alternaria arborescens]RYN43774.1 Baeyer-Villiger monooxygenase [Alternaria arborescens]RYO39164.1 Baeyer-Villiger monooxygenase [Alternaria arborescens]